MIPTIQKAPTEKFRKNPYFFIFNLTLPKKYQKQTLKISTMRNDFLRFRQEKFNSHLTKKLQIFDFEKLKERHVLIQMHYSQDTKLVPDHLHQPYDDRDSLMHLQLDCFPECLISYMK